MVQKIFTKCILFIFILFTGCENAVLSQNVESGEDLDVYASVIHENNISSTNEYLEVQIKQNGTVIQLSNGVVKNGSTNLIFSSTKKAYILDIALTDNTTYNITIILNEGESNEKSYANTNIKYLGVPTPQVKLGSNIGALGTLVSFPSSMASTNGIMTQTATSYDLNGSVSRTEGSSSNTATYEQLHDRYFSPYFINGSGKFETTIVTFLLKFESSGSLDSSFNGGSAKSKVNLTKAVTITR